MIAWLAYRLMYLIALTRVRYYEPVISGQRQYYGRPYPPDVQRYKNALIARSYWLRKSEGIFK